MKKKVIDIQYPQKLEEKKKEKTTPPIQFKKPESKILLPKIRYKRFLFLIPVILIGVLCHITLSRATIEVWPETEIKNFETKVTITKEVESPDFSAQVLPGKIFEKEKTFSEEFSSSGKKLVEKKATGQIRIYNNYSTSSQVLVATTRFVSADGKIFRSIGRVTIPGGQYEKGKLVPGYLDVQVEADKPGPEYNIGPSTFSIPGFAGTDRYTKFYGKSFESMKDGELKEAPQVTKEDLQKAEDSLTEKAKKEIENLLKLDIPSEFVFTEGALEKKILETFSLAKAGMEAEKFTYQVEVQATSLLFKKDDIENFAKSFIASQLSEGKTFYPPSLKINYSPENINLEVGKIILNLEMETKIYSEIDEIYLKKGLMGKSLAEAQISLENQPLITKSQVKLRPFWLRNIPEELEKIDIELRVDPVPNLR